MKVNPEYNKILAEALAKADAQKDFIPMSVIEDIKAKIADMDGDINGYYVHKDDVLAIIDKHIGKEIDNDT